MREVSEDSPIISPISDTSPRMAYLLSQYPARSHTFFLKEIIGLRDRGQHIEVASINKPDRALEELSPSELQETTGTCYIKQASLWRSAFAVIRTAAVNPQRTFRGLQAIKALPSLSLKQRAFWLFYLAEALLVGRWLRQRGLQHLHVHFGGAVASVGMLTSVIWDVPYSLTIHGPEELLDPAGYQLSAKLKQAQFVICISDFCKDSLKAFLSSAEWPKLSVIQLGVDPFQLFPDRRDESSSVQNLSIVCVGRLVPEKGHRILLEAFRLLLDRGVKAQLLLIGTGPLEHELKTYVVESGLHDAVVFTSGLGHEETLAVVRQADIFALASFAEGVPVALMEAMSLEVPCVSTTVAGIPELIQSGDNGLLVIPGDTSAFAAALTQLASDGSLRQRFGHAGRVRVLAEYNLALNLDRLAQHFGNHLASGSSQMSTSQSPRATTQG